MAVDGVLVEIHAHGILPVGPPCILREECIFLLMKSKKGRKNAFLCVVYKFIKASLKHTSSEYVTSTGKCFIIVIKDMFFFCCLLKNISNIRSNMANEKLHSAKGSDLTFVIFNFQKCSDESFNFSCSSRAATLCLSVNLCCYILPLAHHMYTENSVIHFIWYIDLWRGTMLNELHKYYSNEKRFLCFHNYFLNVHFWMKIY